MSKKRKAALDEDAHPKGKGKARAEPGVEEQHSPLFLTLVKKFAVGKISAPEVQEIADAAVKSGSTSADLTKLQLLGSHGSSNKNIHRDLMRSLTRDGTKAPTLREVCTPCVVTDSSGEKVVEEKNIPIMLPHEWVESLDENLCLRLCPLEIRLQHVVNKVVYCRTSSEIWFKYMCVGCGRVSFFFLFVLLTC